MTMTAVSTDARRRRRSGRTARPIIANGFVFCSGTAGIDPATGLSG